MGVAGWVGWVGGWVQAVSSRALCVLCDLIELVRRAILRFRIVAAGMNQLLRIACVGPNGS